MREVSNLQESAKQQHKEMNEKLDKYMDTISKKIDNISQANGKKDQNYVSKYKELIAMKWNKNPDGSLSSIKEQDDIPANIDGLAQNELDSVDISKFVSDAKALTWKYLTETLKIDLIDKVEQKGAKMHVFLEHNANHWLTKRILSRQRHNESKIRKAKTKATTQAVSEPVTPAPSSSSAPISVSFSFSASSTLDIVISHPSILCCIVATSFRTLYDDNRFPPGCSI
ncbi:unnamed protein product [Absidia cylindrospora]